MAHEQSFFFILVRSCSWLDAAAPCSAWVLIAILLSLPSLLIALVANNRRADYVALLAGIAVAWVMVIVLKPASRRALLSTLVLCVLLGGGYVLAFHNASGRSVCRQTRSFQSSSRARPMHEMLPRMLYRTAEDFDLKYTESLSPLLGYGFGKPFLQPDVLPNVASNRSVLPLHSP